MLKAALAGVAQWIEHQPENQRVAGFIHGEGTCLGCRPGPQLGECERQPIYVSLTHRFSSFPLPLSLKINKVFKKKEKKEKYVHLKIKKMELREAE